MRLFLLSVFLRLQIEERGVNAAGANQFVVAAVFGGIGNIPGAVLGGIVLGLGETMLVAFFPGLTGYRDAFAFVLLIVMLLVRPNGLLGEKSTDKV